MNWQNAHARREYKKNWQRQHRVYMPRPALQDAAALFAAAMDQARRTQVALPRDPVLDAWRVQKVVRTAFDTRFGPDRLSVLS